MEGDWAVVADPKKKKGKKKPQNTVGQVQYGGKGAKGTLTAGPVQRAGQSSNFGGYGNQDYTALNNQASNIAEYDFDVTDDLEEVKYETISHSCAQAVAEARH